MPKLIVLFSGGSDAGRLIAKSAADGAKSVRFMEVDVRELGAADVNGYDGVVIVPDGASEAAVDAALHDVAHAGSNVVVGVAAEGALPARTQRMDVIVVSSREKDPEARARALGLRTAKVAAWVRHGLGHEAEDGHTHSHHHHH